MTAFTYVLKSTVSTAPEDEQVIGLRLARADNLLDYAWQDGTDPGGPDYASYRAFLPAVGFRELTRTRLIWARTPDTRAVQKDDHEQH